MAAERPMVRIKDLKKSFGRGKERVEALRGVSLDVNPGEVFGVIGLSGAGKSTLIRCINMLERPDEGTVEIDGVDVGELPAGNLRRARQKIGMIFQHFNLLWSRKVDGNVAFPLEIAGEERSATNERVNEMLKLVGLADKASAYPGQLSGGQKQRVGIARALANRPQVLLCDEATSALDPETTQAILALLKEINREMGLTIIMITHEMAVVEAVCDRVAVIEDGRIVEVGATAEVFENPKAAMTRRMLQRGSNPAEPEAVTRSA